MKKALTSAFRTELLPILAAGILLITASGCRQQQKTGEAGNPPPLVEDMSSGPVECRITAEPAEVHLDRDLLLTIQTRTPATLDIRLPSLENRLQGFVLSGAFDREPVEKNGFIVREHCARLTPKLADEYRLGPLAVTTIDRSRQPPVENWFATHAVTFKAVPVISGKSPASIADILGPVWIYPPFKTVALWIGLALLGAAAAVGLWFAFRRIHKNIQLRRMSPKERALHELAELMAKDLIARNQLKEFYLEITLIVRRYIERAHSIRAPEQTTDEFLMAVMQNPGFSREVVLKLKTFLQTADLVKFAVFRPDQPTVDKTVATASDYVETDEQEQQQREPGHV